MTDGSMCLASCRFQGKDEVPARALECVEQFKGSSHPMLKELSLQMCLCGLCLTFRSLLETLRQI